MEGSLPPSFPSRPSRAPALRARRVTAGVRALSVAIPASAPAFAEVSLRAASSPAASEHGLASTTGAPSRLRGWRTITLGRARFSVPDSWPVVDLTADPSSCVRFDVHAVYLGAQGLQPSCPPGAVGRTEAVQVQPISPRATAGIAFGPPTRLGAQPAFVARAVGVSRAITATFPRLGVAVTASWGANREIADAVVSSFSVAPVSTPTAPPVDSLSGDPSVATTAPLVQRAASSAGTTTASGYVGP